MNARDPMLMDGSATLPRPLLEAARHLTEGNVSTRHHAASRARVFDRCAALTRKKRSTGGVAFIVAGAFAASTAAGAGLFVATGRHSFATATPAPVASTAPGDPLQDTVVDPQAPRQGSLEIEVSPDEAQIYWDGHLLKGNPTIVNGPADGKRHVIRAEAPGYIAKTESAKLSGNGSLSFELQLYPVKFGAIGPPEAGAIFPEAGAVLEAARPALEECFKPEGRTGGMLSGSSLVALTIVDGSVTDVKIPEPASFPLSVRSCLKSNLEDLKFTAYKKPSTLYVPIIYEGMDRAR